MRSVLVRAFARALSFVPALVMAGAVLLAPADARAEGASSPPPSSGVTSETREVRAALQATFAEMRVTSLRVRDQLRLARKRGTPRQIMCVDEALSRADVALRHARALGDEILAAYARGDVEAARTARRQLVELRALQRFAGQEATKCAPSAVVRVELVTADTTTVKVDVDPRIPRVD